MRSRFRIQMLYKRRLVINRMQWVLIGLTSLIALNTTLYLSITQNMQTLPERDVSEFPVRQKIISIDDNWDQPPGVKHWEVIDPVEEDDGTDEEARGKVSLREKQGENARKIGPGRAIKRKAMSTERPNVRYITLKSSVQLQVSEKDSGPVKVTKKQGTSVKPKSDVPKRQIINVQRTSSSDSRDIPIKTMKSAAASNSNGILKSNNVEPVMVVAPITYRSNTSYQLGGTRSRQPFLRGGVSPSSRDPGNGPTKTAILSGTGNIRYYSKPPWLSNEDIQTMRLLSEEEISDVRLLPATFGDQRKAVLFRAPERIFNDEGAINNQRHDDIGLFLGKCKSRGNACAMVLPSNHIHEVLAFHVDRILGFNRTLPSVARNLPEEYRLEQTNNANYVRGTIYPMTAFDANAHVGQDVLFWSKDKFRSCAMMEQSANKLNCEGTSPDEISSLALFDFLLQITDRLDRYCCGLALSDRPLPCGQLSGIAPGSCKGSDQLLGRIFRRGGTGQDHWLVFTPNVVNLNVPSGRLDYLLLGGIESFSEHVLSILRTGKFRQMLLQSLFIDRVYWEGLGGRKAIEDILDVMDRRGKMLVKYLNDKKSKQRT